MSGKKTKIKDLIPDDQNFNTGTEFGGGLIEKSLSKFGAGRSILLDKNNRIIAGNKTVENAAAIGLDDVQIVETDGKTIIAVKRTDIDLDTKRGREMALADNATAKANISWDAAAITEWEMPYQEWGIDLATEIEPAGEADAEPQIDKAAELNEKWKVKAGDLWRIGEHRLLCGDSTDAAGITRLMGGDKAQMLFTDPPYNLDFQGQDLSHTTKGGKAVQHYKGANTKHDAIENDNLADDEFSGWMYLVLTNIETHLLGAWYICFTDLKLDLLLSACRQSGFNWKSIIIWMKNQATLSGKDYKSRYEPIVYGCPENSFFGERYLQEDIWQITRTLSNDLHPTMKPVDVPLTAINNSSRTGDIVLDVFGGSGSTMVAAANTNRRAYLCELTPNYCAVILERMHTAFPDIEIKRIEQAEAAKT